MVHAVHGEHHQIDTRQLRGQQALARLQSAIVVQELAAMALHMVAYGRGGTGAPAHIEQLAALQRLLLHRIGGLGLGGCAMQFLFGGGQFLGQPLHALLQLLGHLLQAACLGPGLFGSAFCTLAPFGMHADQGAGIGGTGLAFGGCPCPELR